MRIFLTGATGYIGAAVLDALVRGGHDVTALVRDNQKAARVTARGGHPVIGNLADPESFRAAADAQDGYIHTAYDSTSSGGPAIDRAALETHRRRRRSARAPPASNGPKQAVHHLHLGRLGARARRQSRRPRIRRSTRSRWSRGGPTTSSSSCARRAPRLRTIVVRPGIVYGGGHGIVGDLLKSASNGLVRVIGDGNNHWPLVYDRDLADLYARLAADENASGVYHANDEGDERVNDIVSAIAPYLPVRPDVRHVPIEEARSKMGAFADALALDQVVRSPRARALGWTPTLHSVAGNAARLLEEWRASRT